jgi:hypothetical protein
MNKTIMWVACLTAVLLGLLSRFAEADEIREYGSLSALPSSSVALETVAVPYQSHEGTLIDATVTCVGTVGIGADLKARLLRRRAVARVNSAALFDLFWVDGSATQSYGSPALAASQLDIVVNLDSGGHASTDPANNGIGVTVVGSYGTTIEWGCQGEFKSLRRFYSNPG